MEAPNQPISPEAAARKLKQHPGWVVERTRIYQDVRFDSFKNALACLNAIADLAEREGHHPNLYLHEWRFLRIELYSHSTGGLGTWDLAMAIAIERLLDSAAGLVR